MSQFQPNRRDTLSRLTTIFSIGGLTTGVVALILLALLMTGGVPLSAAALANCQISVGATSNPAPTVEGPAGAAGVNGLSAYELWLAAGHNGTLDDFFNALVGTEGTDGYIGSDGINGKAGTAGIAGAAGIDGRSAYQLWLDTGKEGEPEEFLNSLIGATGATGTPGPQGTDGLNGLSAYQLWLTIGNQGTISDFLATLVGERGPEGQSAYQLWVANGHPGESEAAFLSSLIGQTGVCEPGATGASGAPGEVGAQGAPGETGAQGPAGASAYEVWLSANNIGTVADFLQTLVGPKGDTGATGTPGASGEQGPQGDPGPTGPPGEPGTSAGSLSFGSFFDTTTQPNTSGIQVMRYNTSDTWNSGVRVNSDAKSKIYFDHPGIYNIQFSSQFAKTDSGTDYVYVWLRKNGVNVPSSATVLRSWGNDDRIVAAWNFFVEVTSTSDYYELAWESADINISMLATGDNAIPGIPSVILTVTQVR